ncbi:uncharacterized protein LOC120812772 isoform X2 [Gasterosteus aculeatus]|uniref:Kit ligand n=1 Tax=Gasterosteus aculeatus aculeatus TaxID=481459 RepID=A0AAQ4PZ31_GASAC|nr:uncharacterized protein LOC120812772 isoform X1 [Gasterosteus aculeatus aculeatus]
MKKPKIWIRLCVHVLLFITLGVHSSRFDINPVTDDISRLSILRQNIPEDYKIPVHYVLREKGGMCWVKLNVFYLEESLKGLAHTFGNISSNRKDISIFIQMFQELRLNMGSLELIMYDFECHYRQERWQTAQYFDFVKDFLRAAQNKEDSDDCDPPPCPTTPYAVTTADYLNDSETRALSAVVEQSFLSLLFIPLLALILLLVWKVRCCRNEEDLEQSHGEGGLFPGAKATATPLDTEISEKKTFKDNERRNACAQTMRPDDTSRERPATPWQHDVLGRGGRPDATPDTVSATTKAMARLQLGDPGSNPDPDPLDSTRQHSGPKPPVPLRQLRRKKRTDLEQGDQRADRRATRPPSSRPSTCDGPRLSGRSAPTLPR